MTGSSGSAAEPRPYRPPFTAHHNTAKAEFEPNAVMVKFKKKATISARKAAVSKVGATAEQSVTSSVVRLTGKLSAPELLKKVKADPTVELASLNYKRRISAVPNDEWYGPDQASYLNTVRVPQAWDVSKSTGNQIVAVLDTGVDAGHPDLVGRLVPGYNAVSSTRPNPVDDNGHGTMTLGIIAAAANNGIGVAGVGWSAKAMPVKVLASDGTGYDADIAEGIDWAVAHGAKVINMSLGGPGDNEVLRASIQNAVNSNVTLIAAAGNDGSNVPHFPAAYPHVIAVGATNAGGALTSFSSYGEWVDIAAPGWDILSPGPRSMTPSGYLPYWYCTGTSCSAPIVAGVAALVKNKWPTFSNTEIATRLKVLARDAGPRGTDPYYGAGILDAYATLGGKWATDFPVNPADGNDQPARATKLTVTASTPATVSAPISVEGEVDWYAVDSAAARNLRVSLTGALFDEDQFPANIGPEVQVYGPDLKSAALAANPFPNELDPGTGGPKWQKLTADTDVSAEAGTSYIAVRNTNGSRDTRPYTLTVSEGGTGVPDDTGWGYVIRDVWPADLSTTAAVTATPTLTFARDMNPSKIGPGWIKLVHGKTGAWVPSGVTYDASARTAVITPNAPLLDNSPYKIIAEALEYADGTSAPFVRTVFSTADLAPQKLTTFTGSGAYLAANLAWTIPSTPDLDQVIVRRNVGSTAPTPTTGTLVYAGTGTAVKNTGLAQGTTYTYAAWVKDRGGKYGPAAVKQLLGMKSGIATTSTLVNYGGSVTIKGSTLRIDNKAYAGLPVNVYVRPKNVSTFKLLAALKTSSTGTVSVVHKPAVSSVYMLTFPGNADLMGTRTADITVNVAPTVSSALSPTAIRLGGTTALSGYVAPAHYGKLVYLQLYSNRAWKSIASVKLSSSGKYAFGIRPAAKGSYAYRAWFPGDADHAQAVSPYRVVTVS
ncbi:S8 family serine peptidase [Kribbella swartbergensis]